MQQHGIKSVFSQPHSKLGSLIICILVSGYDCWDDYWIHLGTNPCLALQGDINLTTCNVVPLPFIPEFHDVIVRLNPCLLSQLCQGLDFLCKLSHRRISSQYWFLDLSCLCCLPSHCRTSSIFFSFGFNHLFITNLFHPLKKVTFFLDKH